MKFVLFGSRANGTSHLNSDWDVVIISEQVNDTTCPEYFCAPYREYIRGYFLIPEEDRIDLFCAHPSWALALHEGAYWHKGQNTWVGWGDYQGVNSHD